MAIQVQIRRGTTTQNNAFTGAVGELTVDTTKDTVVVHDGSTAGGFPLLKENNPSYTGTLTGAGDATLHGLTVGRGAGAVSTNTAVGASALAGGSQSGSENTAIGAGTLDVNTSGSNNTAVGANVLGANTTGGQNSGVGRGVLLTNTTGSNNTAMGHDAMALNTTGSFNVGIGRDALVNNTTASNNTAVGFQAGLSNTTGAENTFTGFSAGYLNTTGYSQSAVGMLALYANTTGIRNQAFGNESLASNTTGNNNTATGFQALNKNTTASGNTAVGYQAAYSNTTGVNSVYLGIGAGYSVTTASDNCMAGYYAGESTTGGGNTFFGKLAGNAVTSGTKNTILGSYNGNQGGLDIRTSSNHIVLSDGDGNPRQWIDNNGAAIFPTQGSAGYGSINLVNDDPFIRFFDNGGTSTADKRKWDVRAIGATGTLDIRTVNDANTVFSTLFSIRHTNGAVGLSTSPATSGTGITFPATQSASSDANTLDDYEEGTFTPEYSFTGGGTVTHGFRSGLYIKIGQLVWISVNIRSTAVSGVSGNLELTGLPFTSAGNSRTGGSIGFIRSWQTDLPNLKLYGSASGTQVDFFKTATNEATNPVTSSDFSTGSDNNVIEFNLVYRASA